ncbi:MAG: YIP1 family protein [Pseudomonadota bacterium]
MNGMVNLMMLSVTRPQEAAAELLGLNLSREVAWLLLGAATVLSVIATFVVSGGQQAQVVQGLPPFSPLMLALFLGCSSIVMGYAIHFTGNAMDGTGNLTNSILVVAWLQVLQLGGLLVQAAALVVSATFSAFVGLFVGVALFFWVFPSFLKVLHGFASMGRAALLMLFVIVGIGLGLTLILGLIGVGM